MPLLTKGFLDTGELIDHFVKHVTTQGDITGITTEIEYLELADNFCAGPLDSNTVEHIRSYDGATIRYNTVSNEFGIVGSDGYIKTYYKPTANGRYFRRQCV